MSEPIRMDGQYQTRDGRPARVLCVDRKGCAFPVMALVEFDGRESVEIFTTNGRTRGEGWESIHDLVPVPKKHKRWVNFYPEGHETRERADYYARSDRIACKEVEFTEGEGLSPATEE